jgi:hypothetical protein
VERKEYIGNFVFFDQMCTTLLICISNHAFLVCFEYKCLKMPYNKLFINLACSVFTEKYRTSVFLYKPRPTGSVCTKETSVRYFSVKTSRSVNKKLINLAIGLLQMTSPHVFVDFCHFGWQI